METPIAKRPRLPEVESPAAFTPMDSVNNPTALLRFQNSRQSQLLKERSRIIADLQKQIDQLQASLTLSNSDRERFASQWHVANARLDSIGRRFLSIPSCQAESSNDIGQDSSQDARSFPDLGYYTERLLEAVTTQEKKWQILSQSFANNEDIDLTTRELLNHQQQRIRDADDSLELFADTRAELALQLERRSTLELRVAELEGSLDARSQELRFALRQLDRSDSNLSQHIEGTPVKSVIESEGAHDRDSGAPNAPAKDEHVEVQQLQEELSSARSICEVRLANENCLQEKLNQMQQTLNEIEGASAVAQGRATQAELAKDLLAQQVLDLKNELQSIKQSRSCVETSLQAASTTKTTIHVQQLQTLQLESRQSRQILADQLATSQANHAQLLTEIEPFRIKSERLNELQKLCSSQAAELKRRTSRADVNSGERSEPNDEDLNNALMSELDDVARQYDEMQDMNGRLLQQIQSIEDCNTQLVADSSRLRQGLEQANGEKQLLVEKEAMLTTVIGRRSEVEGGLRAQIQAQALAQDKLQEQIQLLNSLNEEYKDAASANAIKVLELQDSHQTITMSLESRLRLAEQRMAELTNAESSKRRADEKVSVLQRQLDRNAVGLKGNVDVALERELEQYKRIVKCGVCKDTTKSVVISKCFHVFCRTCIETRLRNRDRRCPACSKPFGQDDVHNIYFTH